MQICPFHGQKSGFEVIRLHPKQKIFILIFFAREAQTMTFEQNFILKCLNFMEQILSDEGELNAAIRHFAKNQVNNPRYQLNSKITEASQWNEHDKLCVSASFFEAIARTSLSFYAENEERAHEISKATAVFQEQYLPVMTEKTNHNHRLDSVKETIIRMKTELKNKIDAEKPYAFFTPVTAGLVVMAAVATTAALFAYKA